MLHGDFKPANLFLDAGGCAGLDFEFCGPGFPAVKARERSRRKMYEVLKYTFEG